MHIIRYRVIYVLKDMQYRCVFANLSLLLPCWVMELGRMKRNGYSFCKNRGFPKSHEENNDTWTMVIFRSGSCAPVSTKPPVIPHCRSQEIWDARPTCCSLGEGSSFMRLGTVDLQYILYIRGLHKGVGYH